VIIKRSERRFHPKKNMMVVVVVVVPKLFSWKSHLKFPHRSLKCQDFVMWTMTDGGGEGGCVYVGRTQAGAGVTYNRGTFDWNFL